MVSRWNMLRFPGPLIPVGFPLPPAPPAFSWLLIWSVSLGAVPTAVPMRRSMSAPRATSARMFSHISASVHPTLDLTSSSELGRRPSWRSSLNLHNASRADRKCFSDSHLQAGFSNTVQREKNQSLEKHIKISFENTAKIKSKDLKERMVSATLVSGLDSCAEIIKVLSGYYSLDRGGGKLIMATFCKQGINFI